MSDVRHLVCPHCHEKVEFKRNSTGTWIGTASGAGVGYALASGLGIAGAILSAPIAIPAGLVGLGIGAIIGNRLGAAIDNVTVECPICKKKMSI